MVILGVLSTTCLLLLLLARVRTKNREEFKKMPEWTLGYPEHSKVSDTTLFVRRNFLEEPQNRPILFLHGIGASSYCWRDLLPLMPPRLPWIAIDLAGFGASAKDPSLNYGLDEQSRRIREALKSLKVNEVDIVGSSLGGALGFWMCHQYPEIFKRFVGISPAIPTRPRKSLSFFGELERSQTFKRSFPWLRVFLNESFVHFVIFRVRGSAHPLSRDQRLRILSPYLDDGSSIICFVKSLDLLRDDRLSLAWQSSSVPTVLIWGRKDRVMPIKALTALLDQRRDIQTLIIEGAGHHPMEDAPQKVWSQISTFLKG